MAFVRPGRRLSLRNVLVVAQIVMSLVLLCATGLFLRSLERAVGIDIGFRSRDVLMLSVDPRVHGYTPERTTQFLDQLRERVAAIPGVVSVAATDSVPLSGGNRSDGFQWKPIEVHRLLSNRGAVYGDTGLLRNHGDPPAGGPRLRQRSSQRPQSRRRQPGLC